MLNLRFVVEISLIALMVHGAQVVCGQDYPSRPIRIAVSGVGSTNDTIARFVAQGISGPLGQQVIVVN